MVRSNVGKVGKKIIRERWEEMNPGNKEAKRKKDEKNKLLKLDSKSQSEPKG